MELEANGSVEEAVPQNCEVGYLKFVSSIKNLKYFRRILG